VGGDLDRAGVTDVPLGVESRRQGQRAGPGAADLTGPGAGQASPPSLASRSLSRLPPAALVLTGAISVQVGAGFAAKLFTQIPPAAVTGLRLWAAAVVLALAGMRGLVTAVRGVARRRAWRDAAVVTGFGVSLAVMNFAIYQSFARIPLGIAVTIEFLGPLGLAVASSRRRLDLLWVVLAGGGVALLARTGSAAATPGLGYSGRGAVVAGFAFALLAASCWVAYILLSRATGRRFPGTSGLTAAMVVAAILITPAGVATGGGALLRPDVLAIGAVIGLMSSIIPYSLELETLRRIPARVFGIWMSLEPAIAALVGLVLLGQSLSWPEWVAIAGVMVACAGAARGAGEPQAPQA
jgi:inner membrane transporter RhtA